MATLELPTKVRDLSDENNRSKSKDSDILKTMEEKKKAKKDRFICSYTGAHFDYDDMYGKLLKLSKDRQHSD